jgi:VWA domain-containing protein
MFGKSSIPERSEWLQDVNSMMASAAFHLVLLITLGLLSSGVSGSGPSEKIVVTLGAGQNEHAAQEAPAGDDIKALGEEIKGVAAAQASPEAALEPTAALGPSQLEGDPGLAPADFSALATVSEKPVTLGDLNGTELSGPHGSGTGGVNGPAMGGGRVGDSAGVKASTRFFGIGGYGKSFVYVVDCSSSMLDAGKFDRARYELLQSIEQLSKDQSYFVIFYNHQAHPMLGEHPVRATEDQIKKTTQWVQGFEAGGGTFPLPALLQALSMRPDAIYFLSDGQFDPSTIQELRTRNRGNVRLHTRPIPIHTIAFYDRFAEGLMRAIARNSGGDYRFVGE